MTAERDFLVTACATIEQQYWVEASTADEARAKIEEDHTAGSPVGEGCLIDWTITSVKSNPKT
jgi:hypothetical protein